MRPIRPLPIVIALGLVWIALYGGQVGGCTLVGQAPPFKTDKPSVLVIEETTERAGYTQDQLNVIDATDPKSVRAKVLARGGQFEHIDKDTPPDRLVLAPAWAQEAFRVKRDSLPWIVGASARSGFSVPLTTEADALKRVEGLR